MKNVGDSYFQNIMWQTKWIVLFAVVFGLIGAVVLFVIGSEGIFRVAKYTYVALASGEYPKNLDKNAVSDIIGAVDLYLIGIVMLIFSFGVYELFISPIKKIKDNPEENRILLVTSLDQLKDKLAKVIIMVLVVNFFQRVLQTKYDGALEMLYFALAVTALSVGLYFLSKIGKH